MNFSPFNFNGKWYKGNLHSHSTVSDGKYSPEELKEIYKKNGYNFLTLTDHDIYKDHSKLNEEQFIFYKGVEIKSYKNIESACGDLQSYHFLCFPKPLQKSDNALFAKEEKFTILKSSPERFYQNSQNLIDTLNNKREAMVSINHPVWSRLTLNDLLAINNYFAIEIYNTQCAIDGADAGEATLYWDFLLREGKKVWAYAADDNHNLDYLMREETRQRIPEDNDRWSSCKAWVCVFLESLSVENISKALLDGKFYSSTGPIIYDYKVEDSKVKIRCSKVRQINFISYDIRGESVISREGLEYAEYELKGTEIYFRIECHDFEGKVAWSNPIFLDEIKIN